VHRAAPVPSGGRERQRADVQGSGVRARCRDSALLPSRRGGGVPEDRGESDAVQPLQPHAFDHFGAGEVQSIRRSPALEPREKGIAGAVAAMDVVPRVLHPRVAPVIGLAPRPAGRALRRRRAPRGRGRGSAALVIAAVTREMGKSRVLRVMLLMLLLLLLLLLLQKKMMMVLPQILHVLRLRWVVPRARTSLPPSLLKILLQLDARPPILPLFLPRGLTLFLFGGQPAPHG
jgi:hypothetical protein